MNTKEARARRSRKTRLRIAEQRAHRLVVGRSICHIYAQIIAPSGDKVLAAPRRSRPTVRKDLKTAAIARRRGSGQAQSTAKAKAAGIEAVAFGPLGYKYHGRVKALAEAAREGGLKF